MDFSADRGTGYNALWSWEEKNAGMSLDGKS